MCFLTWERWNGVVSTWRTVVSLVVVARGWGITVLSTPMLGSVHAVTEIQHKVNSVLTMAESLNINTSRNIYSSNKTSLPSRNIYAS